MAVVTYSTDCEASYAMWMQRKIDQNLSTASLPCDPSEAVFVDPARRRHVEVAHFHFQD